MATGRELLESYQGGARQAGSDVNFLLRKLRRDMELARQEDMQRKKNIKSAGKTGFNLLKTRREYLLAKRVNPDLTFKEFLLDPRTAGQYMLEGSKKIISGEAMPLTLRETFGFGTPRQRVSESFLSDNLLEQTRSSARSSIASAEQDLLPDVKVESTIPGSLEYASLPQTAEITKQQPIQMAQVDVMPEPKPSVDALRKVRDVGVENLGITEAEVIDPLQDATQKTSALGTAGNVLGTVGSLASLGSGISDIARGRGDLSAVARTGAGAAGLASLAGMANPLLGAGLGLLSLISKRRR
jgi:hypothetical protein